MTGEITIIGAGLAGLSCAHALAREGARCTLVSALPSERAQSVMAEGGINAALDVMGEHDTAEEHVADTLRSAAGLASERAIREMCEAAPQIARDLIAMGVPFQTEGGRLVQRHFGGQRKARTAYARSSTGKALVSALVDAVRADEAAGLVRRMPRSHLVALDIADGICAGAWAADDRTGEVVWLAAPVVLACGGLSGVFGPRTTGTTVNTGDVAALCLASGVELANLEMIQYHPTTVAVPDKRLLVSEAARGEGGRLFALRDGEPWHFMEELHPELGNLGPRDVVSREEAALLEDPSCGGVFLDMRHLPRDAWERRLPDLRDEIIRYLGIDPAREPIAVEPGIHYSMGGIRVDAEHATNVDGLFAAGECACQYHGANRLGGNSLLGAIHGGRVAAGSALAWLGGGGVEKGSAGPAPDPPAEGALAAGPLDDVVGEGPVLVALQDALAASLGVIRDRERLEEGLARIREIGEGAPGMRFRARALLSRAMVECALVREESRGAHFRHDFPEARESLALQTVVILDGQDARIRFEEPR